MVFLFCPCAGVKAFQTFVETLQEGIDGKKEGAAEEEVVLDLDEGVLETNYGIPMIVVATKSDAIESRRCGKRNEPNAQECCAEIKYVVDKDLKEVANKVGVEPTIIGGHEKSGAEKII